MILRDPTCRMMRFVEKKERYRTNMRRKTYKAEGHKQVRAYELLL